MTSRFQTPKTHFSGRPSPRRFASPLDNRGGVPNPSGYPSPNPCGACQVSSASEGGPRTVKVGHWLAPDQRVASLVLTVRQVEVLEESLWDEELGLVDKYASGVFLFCLFSRSRISDIRKVHGFVIDVVTEGGVAVGFLECATRTHKTALQAQTVGVSMPLVAPVNGVRSVPWGLQFIKIVEEVGLPFGGRDKGPLLPAPAQVGGWTGRAVSSSEAGSWLRALLSRGNSCGDGVSGHSLKSTTPDWCGKYGMSDKDQTLLGHHALESQCTDIRGISWHLP